MEFEKLIKIKNALEHCAIHDCSDSCIFSEKHPFACLTEMHNQLLTLINEFESEYYQLKQNLGECENGYKLELHTARYQLYSANEALKKAQDRISELESENKRLKEGKFIIIRK